jgi:hypothetical protein
MFRVAGIKKVGLYPTNFPAAEDYAYFFRFAKNFETANYQEALVTIQKDPNGISLQKRRQQLISRIKVILHNFEWNIYGVWGLIRAIAFLFIPTFLIEFTKRKLWNDDTSHH